MKNSILFLISVFMLAMPVILLADTGDPPNPKSMEIFASMSALIAGVVAITALLKTFLGTTGIFTEIVSWIIGPLIAFIGFFFKLGIFIAMPWYMALFYGILAAFSANKGWDIYKIFAGNKSAAYK
ncbi:MAG: hypothetical protein Q8J88_11245 [Bacteroidales bacterium]|nr:hypothetical protein [Bacteroidales bacterium]